MTTRRLVNAISLALLQAKVLCVSLAIPTLALTQDSSNLERPVELVTVTGSRIPASAAVTPLLVIDREAIDQTGLVAVGDLLQDLSIAGSGLNPQVNNGGDGSTRLNLRSLGPGRVLILLNGRRVNADLTGVVDLGSLPLAIVERIEVLKDGASTIYGSDAIAGVVNIITRTDFEGLRATSYLGQFADGDGEVQHHDLSAGVVGDQGTLFFNVSYDRGRPVLSRNRRISAEPQFGTGNAFGSSFTPQGRLLLPGVGNVTTDPGAQVTGPGGLGAAAFRPADFSFGRPGAGADRYNFAQDLYLSTPFERTNIFTQAEMAFGDAAALRVEASYTERESSQLLSATPLALGLFGGGLIGIAQDNRYNVFEAAFPADGFALARRLVETGGRRLSQRIATYRLVTALSGSMDLFARAFDWEVSYLIADQDGSSRHQGAVDLSRVQRALSGQPCRDDLYGDGCVELDVFGGQGPNGNGTITRAMLDYITFTAQQRTQSTLRSYQVDLVGPLWRLNAGDVDVAVGIESRETEGSLVPDARAASGGTTAGADQPTRGTRKVDEFYLELALPVWQGDDHTRRLDVRLSARHSRYDVVGDTTNSKVSVLWQPVSSLRLRSTWSEGFRAPSIRELFGGQFTRFVSLGDFSDPCSDMLGLGGGTPAPALVIERCVANGVPADGSYRQVFGIGATGGSNPALQPETSRSVTAGLVYTPDFVDDLQISADYYRIEVEDAIDELGAQAIADICVFRGELCHLIRRGPIGSIIDLLDAGVNIGTTRISGIDFEVNWGFDVLGGRFNMIWDAAYQSDNQEQRPQSRGPGLVTADRLGVHRGDSSFPRWKSRWAANWSRGDWAAQWVMQYVHHTRETCTISPEFGFCNLDLDGDAVLESRRIGALTYHDVQVSYHASPDVQLTAGVLNVFDKGPPLATSSFNNSFSTQDYRVPGRFPYLRVRVDF